MSVKISNSSLCYATAFGVFVACLIVPAKANEDKQNESIAATDEPAKQADKPKKSFSGNISWYGPGFHGRKTASGELFDMNKLTAAHLTLPFGTRVLVEDPRTGNTVIMKVNDRGPYVRSRVMDLSREGARELGTLQRGTAFVDCLILKTK
jgi:rare lipoprotein A